MTAGISSGSGRITGLVAAIALVTLVLTACRAPGSDVEVDTAGLAQLREFSDDEPVVLPALLPPRFESVSVASADDLTIVDFYSTNEPMVTICHGTVRRCRDVIQFASEVRTVRADGAVVVVGTAPREARADPLTADVAAFWDQVEFTTTPPPWLRPD